MDKTIKINLAGILFQIDEEAYHLLRDYLQAIDSHFNNVPGGTETIDDIESRIAEIFRSQQNNAGVISKENVEAMIAIIGNPDDFEQPESIKTKSFTRTRRRLYRNPDDSIISGVCSGIGAYLNIDPVWIRIIFIVAALFFGVGIFIYIAMWIALPYAFSENQKKELYGANYSYRANNPEVTRNGGPGKGSYRPGEENGINKVGGVFNEIFRATGKFFFILFRIVMILLGISFVIAGFSLIVVFVMGFFFKFPGFMEHGSFNTNLFYLPDLLDCVVNPALTPWIIVLSFIVILLPLLALVYWGIRMIFWFRARDGVISLIFLVIWVMSIVALSIILFNEGVSFSESAKISSQEIFTTPPDTLRIISSAKVNDLKFTREFSIPHEQYTVFVKDSGNNLAIRPRLRLYVTKGKMSKAEINKRSFGHSRSAALQKAESLIYNYKIAGDTLMLDEYFTIPKGSKWSADDIWINLYFPEKTVLYFDKGSENLFGDWISINRTGEDMEDESYIEAHTEPWELGGKYWTVTDEGLKETERAKPKRK